MKSLDSRSDLPPDPPLWVKLGSFTPSYESNLGHKIADFVFLPCIYFILAFTALECIKNSGKPYVKSLDSWSDLPPDPPLWVKLGS